MWVISDEKEIPTGCWYTDVKPWKSCVAKFRKMCRKFVSQTTHLLKVSADDMKQKGKAIVSILVKRLPDKKVFLNSKCKVYKKWFSLYQKVRDLTFLKIVLG